jgi:hypothetical protein
MFENESNHKNLVVLDENEVQKVRKRILKEYFTGVKMSSSEQDFS